MVVSLSFFFLFWSKNLYNDSDIPRRGTVNKTYEKKLPFTVDPNRNYMAEIDKIVPPWNPENYQKNDTLQPGCAFSENSGPNTFVDKDGREYTEPHFKYVRALHPQGHILPLIVSTVRPSPEFPTGEDGVGTEPRVKAEKISKGWRILEPGESFSGYADEEYLAWALAVRDWRIHCNKHYENKDKNDWQSKQEQATKAQSDATAKLIKELTEGQDAKTAALIQQIATTLGKAVADATMASTKKAKD